MTSSGIPLRYRLTVRQSVPILAGFIGILSCLLVMGYLYTREQIVESARLQVAQMMGSMTRPNGYSHRWVERCMQPVLKIASTLPALCPEQRTAADKAMTAIISDERGKQTVEISIFDKNMADEHALRAVWQRSYGSAGVLPLDMEDQASKPFAPSWWTAESLAAFTTARWHEPLVKTTQDSKYFFTLRYSAPLFTSQPDGARRVAGVCTISLDTPWFAERIRSFSTFKDCLIFFLSHSGQWTLPPEAEGPLGPLKRQMLAQKSGELSVTYEGKQWLAVFMPLMDGSQRMGVLIPRDTLFAGLNKLTQWLAVCGIAVLVLAAGSLHHTSVRLLSPLTTLHALARRMARGELHAPPDPTAALPAPPYPDEVQRLKMITEKLRQDLRQRVHDLTLMGRTRERLFGELTFARSLQDSLRPAPLPPLPGVEMATFVYTAADMRGDLYDYFLPTPQSLCCVMGNVTESGVPAALLMGRLGPLLHELLLSGMAPGRALENINRMLSPALPCGEDTPPISAAPARSSPPTSPRPPMPPLPSAPMTSVLAGILDMPSGLFRWASAGQFPPLHCKGNTVEPLAWTSNVPLGIRKEELYQEKEVQLKPGEILLFVGQRLLSLTGTQGQRYTEEHMHRFWENRQEGLEELLPLFFAHICEVLGRTPQDDLTFFAVRWQPEAAE